MQLLDSLQDRQPAPAPLLAALQDIVSKVQIQSRFCIRHSDYKPLELKDKALERFQQLPLDLQNQYLSRQLRSFLYGIYYNGSLQTAMTLNTEADNRALPQNIENNTIQGVDLAFYERLHQNNSGEGHFEPGWQVLRQEDDGSLAVSKGGLTLHIDRDRHLRSEDRSAGVGDLLAIRLPCNRVQNGFYKAVGNAGPKSLNIPDDELETVRVYFNLSTEGAVAVMGSLTRQLNDINIPFTFKVLYNPTDYGRYDSGVLYFDKSDREVVWSVLQTIYTENQSHFQPQVPLFAKLLAPGLAVAEEPDCKFTSLESFGTNRCQIVANGLIEAWQNGDETTEGRMAAIRQQFSSLELDWQRPYLNADSEDIYTPLEL